MMSSSVTVFQDIWTLTVVYWAASLFVLLLRTHVKSFRELVQYGGRVVRSDEDSKAGGRGKQKEKLIGEKAARRAGAPSAAVPLWLRPVAAAIDMVQRSFLGTTRVNRQTSFIGFYVAGLCTCALLWWSTPADPCVDFAEAIVERELNISRTLPAFASLSAKARKECLDVRAPLLLFEMVPLILFGLHCTVRLVECSVVHRFRGGPGDTVSLFAAVAGCSFYVFAAVSSAVHLMAAARYEWLRSVAQLPSPSVYLKSRTGPQGPHNIVTSSMYLSASIAQAVPVWLPSGMVWACASCHLCLQGLQVVHHRVLASLRSSTEQVSPPPVYTKDSSDDDEKDSASNLLTGLSSTSSTMSALNSQSTLDGVQRRSRAKPATGAAAAAAGAGENTKERWQPLSETATSTKKTPKVPLPTNQTATTAKGGADANRVWSYHFPTDRLFFRFVLEPHYGCEVLQYVVSGTVVVVLLIEGFVGPLMAAGRGNATTADLYSDSAHPFAMLLSLQLAAAAGVTVFSFCNLAVTAAEHRTFWEHVNSTRMEAWLSLVQTFVAPQPANLTARRRVRRGNQGEEDEDADTILEDGWLWMSKQSRQEFLMDGKFPAPQLEQLPHWDVLLGLW